MSKRQLEIQNLVIQKCQRLGDTGLEWLANLSDLINDLERDWQITLGSSLDGGSASYVAHAKTRDGTDAILKLAMPEMDGNGVFANEVWTLKLADGHGYARLLAHDFERRAMLQEQLGVPLQKLAYSVKDQIEIICASLKDAWRPVTSETPLISGTHSAQEHARFITGLWEDLHRPCSQRSFDLALRFAESRRAAFDPQTSVLVHGDAHNGNLLLASSQTSAAYPQFKFIDPEGLVAEPAFDLGVLMREWIEDLTEEPVKRGYERCALLSSLTGVDKQGIWEWGFIQCVATGLFLLHLKEESWGMQTLRVAEAWSEHGDSL